MRKDGIIITTNGTYPWSSVRQIFSNGSPSHGGDRNNIQKDDFNLTKRNPGFRSFLVSSYPLSRQS